MEEKVIYIAVCGILTRPGNAENWTGKFVTHTHINTPYRAEKVEYYVTPIFNRFFKGRRVEKLRSTMNWYLNNGFKIHLVGHSNGCDIILRALEAEHWPTVESVTLFSAATKRDISRVIPHMGKEIKSLKLLMAQKDFALKLAGFWKFVDYGTLGLLGPKFMPPDKEQFLKRIIKPNFRHSTWFSPMNFAESMEHVFNHDKE